MKKEGGEEGAFGSWAGGTTTTAACFCFVSQAILQMCICLEIKGKKVVWCVSEIGGTWVVACMAVAGGQSKI